MPFVQQVSVAHPLFLFLSGSDSQLLTALEFATYIHVDLAEVHVCSLRNPSEIKIIRKFGSAMFFRCCTWFKFRKKFQARNLHTRCDRRPGVMPIVLASLAKANAEFSWKTTRGMDEIMKSASVKSLDLMFHFAMLACAMLRHLPTRLQSNDLMVSSIAKWEDYTTNGKLPTAKHFMRCSSHSRISLTSTQQWPHNSIFFALVLLVRLHHRQRSNFLKVVSRFQGWTTMTNYPQTCKVGSEKSLELMFHFAMLRCAMERHLPNVLQSDNFIVSSIADSDAYRNIHNLPTAKRFQAFVSTRQIIAQVVCKPFLMLGVSQGWSFRWCCPLRWAISSIVLMRFAWWAFAKVVSSSWPLSQVLDISMWLFRLSLIVLLDGVHFPLLLHYSNIPPLCVLFPLVGAPYKLTCYLALGKEEHVWSWHWYTWGTRRNQV